jgi:hypothetical protein
MKCVNFGISDWATQVDALHLSAERSSHWIKLHHTSSKQPLINKGCAAIINLKLRLCPRLSNKDSVEHHIKDQSR